MRCYHCHSTHKTVDEARACARRHGMKVSDAGGRKTQPAPTRPRPKKKGRGSKKSRTDEPGKGHDSGTTGYYGGLPKEQTPQKKAGVCNACGVTYGYDGACACR